jgi:hypothetical protein
MLVFITWIGVFIAEVEYSQHKCWYSSHELEYSLQKLSIHNMNSINVIFFKLKKQIFNWWKVNNFLIFVHRYFSLQATHPLGFDSKCRFDVEENICREEGPLPDCFNKPREMVLYTIEKVHYIYLWKRTPPPPKGIYSQTCMKRSSFGTRIKWHYKTGDLLKEV